MAEKDHKLNNNNGAKDWENPNKISKILMASTRPLLARDIRWNQMTHIIIMKQNEAQNARAESTNKGVN